MRRNPTIQRMKARLHGSNAETSRFRQVLANLTKSRRVFGKRMSLAIVDKLFKVKK